MDDISEITQLILRERQGRDRGWWRQMRDCFAPDATVRVSWFGGSATDFARKSEEMSGRGDGANHRLSPPVVHLQGGRAIVEVPAAIEVRTDLEGVEADLTSYTRLLYRARQDAGNWRIASLDCVYERDTLEPTLPGAPLRLDAQKLAGYRGPYRFLAYHLSGRGYEVANDLYGDDRPEAVIALYGDAFAWLRDRA